MEPKTEPEPEFVNFCYPKPNRNRQIKEDGTGTGGTENFYSVLAKKSFINKLPEYTRFSLKTQGEDQKKKNQVPPSSCEKCI